MRNLLVWEIIAGLTPKEKREVKLFLDSPYFNHREDVRLLFHVLAQADKLGDELLEREVVFSQIYSGKKYDDQKMRLLLSNLLKLLEQYLVQAELKNFALAQPHLLLTAYRKRKLPRHFQTTLKQVNKKLENQPLRHSDFHLEKYRVEWEQYQFLADTDRTQALNLQVVEDQLSAATVSMKLRQMCILRSHEAVFNTIYEIVLQREVLQVARRPPLSEMPAVKVYLLCMDALFSEQGDFLLFKNYLLESVAWFPVAEMRDLYLLAINYCIKKINQNDARYYQEAHDLYRAGLESGLLLEDGKINHFTYNNIVGLSIRIPEVWAWVEWFVEAFRDHLDPEYREAYFSLSSARLEFARKNYDAALQHLQHADYRDLINNLIVKTLQMKIYFEMDEYQLLDSHLSTMHMFVRRNRKLGYHRENWSNIVRYTRKLMELNPFDEQAWQVLRSEIENEEILTEKEWLLGQMAG